MSNLSPSNLILAAVLIFSGLGCTSISKEEIANANFGIMPLSYQVRIKSHYDESLVDPYSAHYDIGTPYKAAIHRGYVYGGGWIFGYAVDVMINAKNRYGGYVGRQLEVFFFNADGKMQKVPTPSDPAFFQRIE